MQKLNYYRNVIKQPRPSCILELVRYIHPVRQTKVWRQDQAALQIAPNRVRQVVRLDREYDPRRINLILPSACASLPEVGASAKADWLRMLGSERRGTGWPAFLPRLYISDT